MSNLLIAVKVDDQIQGNSSAEFSLVEYGL
jgi:hypothetical protein